jgi:xylulokinase
MACFLGADIGTTNVKAILVDGRQRIVAAATAPLVTLRPRTGWSEQDPRTWWSAFVSACSRLSRQAPKQWREVASIGLTGQMHACLCLDEKNRPLRPAMLWDDGRAVAESTALANTVPGLSNIAGVAAMPGFTAPKLLWLHRHEPHILQRTSHVIPAKDYVRLKLTGEHVTDVSEAAGCLLLDQETRQWSRALLEATGVTLAMLPRLVEGSQQAGVLTRAASRRLGLGPHTIVAGGGGDAAAGAIGIGAIEENQSFISLGTSAQYFRVRSNYRPHANPSIHVFAHCLPGRWYEMAALLNGASCLDWARRLLRLRSLDDALADVAKRFRSPAPLLFFPYLAGERTPYNDPSLRGMIVGLGHATSSIDLVQAVLEGVAFALAEAQSCLGEHGSPLSPIGIVGGGARSLEWVQIIADVLGRELVIYRGAASAAPFGAARLARLAFTGETPGSVCVTPQTLRTLKPRPAAQLLYRKQMERFRQLQPALQIAKAR